MNHAIKEWMPHLWKGGVPHWYYNILLITERGSYMIQSYDEALTETESLKSKVTAQNRH